jgi:DNA repair protein RecN (Recombination protein N)
MLTSLRVKNLALVENIRLDFRPGLNVITGETGAGKSILVGALGLLLGERADRKVIREGEDACGAEAVFHFKNTKRVDAILDQFGLPPCEEGQLIVRRILKVSGASQNLVNDSPVTLQVLKALGEELVDMHGPHDHQSLLNPSFQLDVLDAYGHHGDAREGYEESFRKVQGFEEQRQALLGNDQDVAAQVDLLAYRVKEIEDAALEDGEEEKVTQEHLVVSNAARILELGGGVLRAVSDGETSALDVMAQVQHHLEELERVCPQAAEWRGEARSIAIQLKELGASMATALDRIEADPGRLAWLDERIATYQKMRRKYGASVPEILEVLRTSKARLAELQTRGERLAKIDAELSRARAELQRRGGSLRRMRTDTAGKLARAVTQQLKELGFPHGAFHVDLRDTEPMLSGMDEAVFGFAPNAGESMKPLRDIASSGEISRVMLATKASLAGHDRIPVLIFDEIDANIGGEMGRAVGQKLADLAKSHQIICITHLPQVAIFGGTHYAVSKHVRNGRTFTETALLEKESRVEEVARMLGGRDLTKVTLQHAKEMLETV